MNEEEIIERADEESARIVVEHEILNKIRNLRIDLHEINEVTTRYSNVIHAADMSLMAIENLLVS